jgi:hypothetical protein
MDCTKIVFNLLHKKKWKLQLQQDLLMQDPPVEEAVTEDLVPVVAEVVEEAAVVVAEEVEDLDSVADALKNGIL